MRVCSKTKHVTLVTHNICKSQIHTLSALQSNKKESLSSSVLIYSSKRYWNKRNQFRLTRKQRSKRKEHERKYQNSYNDDSNWFPEVDVDTQTIPISMKAPPQNSNKVHKPLKLDDEFWKHWQSVEHSLNLESLYQEIEKNVNEIVNSFDYKLRFANPSDKSKVRLSIFGFFLNFLHCINMCIYHSYCRKYVNHSLHKFSHLI